MTFGCLSLHRSLVGQQTASRHTGSRTLPNLHARVRTSLCAQDSLHVRLGGESYLLMFLSEKWAFVAVRCADEQVRLSIVRAYRTHNSLHVRTTTCYLLTRTYVTMRR